MYTFVDHHILYIFRLRLPIVIEVNVWPHTLGYSNMGGEIDRVAAFELSLFTQWVQWDNFLKTQYLFSHRRKQLRPRVYSTKWCITSEVYCTSSLEVESLNEPRFRDHYLRSTGGSWYSTLFSWCRKQRAYPGPVPNMWYFHAGAIISTKQS